MEWILSTLNCYISQIKNAITTYNYQHYELDNSTKVSIQIGIALGFMTLLLLSYFPGEPTGIPYGDSFDETFLNSTDTTSCILERTKNDKKADDDTNKDSNKNKINSITDSKVPKDKQNNYKQRTNGNVIIKPKAKELQKLLNITDDDMKQLLSKATSPSKKQQPESSNSYSLSQVVNFIVYTTLFSSLLYVVNRDTDGAVVEMLINYFPREAKVLKLI